MPVHPVFPSIASVLAQHVDFKEHFDSKDHPLDTSSDSLPVWVREWLRIHNSVQSSAHLPNVFEQAFTVALNTKDINPNLHIPKHIQEEQETAIIETAQVAQAVHVHVQVKLQAIQASNATNGSLVPSLIADTGVPTSSLPPSVLPVISITPANPPIAATSAPTHKQASSISTAERQPNGKYLSVPEWNYITNIKARSSRRKELAKKTKEQKTREERRAVKAKRWSLKLKCRLFG
jgi:hypothetical protein